MRVLPTTLVVLTLAAACDAAPTALRPPDEPQPGATLDERLAAELARRGFTGRVEESLERRLGRPVDPRLADLGRLLFFDPILSLTRDNSCSGCHAPNAAFNDAQSISIGIDNNGVVGPGRRGPFNQRRAPTVLNAAFYPRLMWDSRFFAVSLDPFDNSRGFVFPAPDGTGLSYMRHLLGAQAFTPVATAFEMTGFDFQGDADAVRAEVARRVDAVSDYHAGFAGVYPEVAGGTPLRFEHIGAALSEFMFTLVRADAPLDHFARGEHGAMGDAEKRGALLFFGRAKCAECHLTHDFGSEMFSDFEPHVIGVPQIVPEETNAPFDGPGADEDFGLERQSGDPDDRYKFRTSPLRNVALQPTFMHDGAYVCLEDAVRHHLAAAEMARGFDPSALDAALQPRLGPIEPVLARLQTLIRTPPSLSEVELRDLLEFVRVSLTDPEAAPDRFRELVPERVPSGLPVHHFQFDEPGTARCSS